MFIFRRNAIQFSIKQYNQSTLNNLNNKLIYNRKFSINNQLTSLSNDFIDDLWPFTRMNTGIIVCPEGYKMVIHRLGKFDRIADNGIVYAIPFIETISHLIDMRSKEIIIKNEKAITKDNINVMLSVCIHFQFVDVKKVIDTTINPFTSLRNHSKSAIKAVISEIDLNRLLDTKSQLGLIIKNTIEDTSKDWGISIIRCDLHDLILENSVNELLDKHSLAQRELQHKLVEAEANKKLALLSSEAEKLKLENEAEANAMKLYKEAEGKKKIQLLESETEAELFQIKIKSQIKAIEELSKCLSGQNALDAAKFVLATELIKSQSKSDSNAKDIDHIIQQVNKTLSNDNK